MKKPSLFQELLNKKNHYFNEDESFFIAKTLTDFLYVLMIVFLITAFILLIISNYLTVFINLSFNDYLSLCFGNVCFYFCFKFINERVIPYYKSNPIFIIGIIYPAFFNSSLIYELLYRFNLIAFDIKLALLLLSIIIYYLILNRYYQSKQQYKN